MTQIDPEQERIRLAGRYSQMSDPELEEVGQDPSQLTGWARSALADEMHRRGLELRPAHRSASVVQDQEILMRLGTYENRNTAAAVGEFLSGRGITTFYLEAEPTDLMELPEENESVHTQLLVRAGDLASARVLIARNEKADLQLQSTSSDEFNGDRPVVLRIYRDMPRHSSKKVCWTTQALPVSSKMTMSSAWIGCGLTAWGESNSWFASVTPWRQSESLVWRNGTPKKTSRRKPETRQQSAVQRAGF